MATGCGGAGAGVGFRSEWTNNGGSGGRSTIAAQMATARGLRSWRGGDRVKLAGWIGGAPGTLGEGLGNAGCVLEGDSRAIVSGGGGEAGSGSRTIDCGGLGLRAGITVELPELWEAGDPVLRGLWISESSRRSHGTASAKLMTAD